MISSPVLAKFNRNKKTRVSADASSYGIGAVLEQLQHDDVWKPIYFCSKTLSDAERRYAQIEKEALAVTWACERLEQFLLGMSFHIQTDHKPLTVILETKEINKLSNRLQRFRMRLLKFNYKIFHVPGKSFAIPDALSRAPLQCGQMDEDVQLKDNNDIYINAVVRQVSAELCSEDHIRNKQNDDPEICKVMKYICDGWPQKSDTTPTYFKFRDDLKIVNNILLYKDRIVIPSSLRRWCLETIHEGHFGIVRCLAKAKETVWWPGINQHIKDRVEKCEVCLQHRQTNVEPMIPAEIPSRPWEMIGADLAMYKGTTYIVARDYYSKYPEIRKLKHVTSKDIIEFFRDIFARHGIPDTVRTDNGRQFNCSEFRTFAKNYGFKWTNSSPEYQQANGEAENTVKLLKNILRKCDDPYLGLLAYRNTPLSCGLSPAELLYGRKLKDRVPTMNYKLLPKEVNHQIIREKMLEEKSTQKKNYDRRHRVKDREGPKIGDTVWIINMKQKGIIKRKAEEPRSFWIETNKQTVRRNQKYLQVLPPVPEAETVEHFEDTHHGMDETRPKRVKKLPERLKDFLI